MLLAASALALTLLQQIVCLATPARLRSWLSRSSGINATASEPQQIEEASHAQPPIFRVKTLLDTAALFPAKAGAAVRDERSRYRIQTRRARIGC